MIDYDTLFRERIAPQREVFLTFRASVKNRVRALRLLRIGATAGMVVFAWLSWVTLRLNTSSDIVFGFGIAAGACAVAAILSGLLKSGAEKRLRAGIDRLLLHPIANAFGFSHTRNVDHLLVLDAEYLLPSYDISAEEEAFRGKIGGYGIEMLDVSLNRNERKRIVEVFHGLIIRIALRNALDGRIAVIPRDDMITEIWDDLYRRGERLDFLSTPDFQKQFGVFADHPDAGYTLLTAEARETLLSIHKQAEAHQTMFGFDSTGILLCLDLRGDFAHLGDALEIKAFQSLGKLVYQEFSLIEDIVGQLIPVLQSPKAP